MTRYLVLVLIYSSFNIIFAVEKRCDFRIFLSKKEQRNNKSDPFEVGDARQLLGPLALNRLNFFENIENEELILRGFSNPAIDSENETVLTFKKIKNEEIDIIRIEGSQYGENTQVDISQRKEVHVDGHAYTKTITDIKGVISNKRINLSVEEITESGKVTVSAQMKGSEESTHSDSTLTFDIDEIKEEDLRRNLFNFNARGAFLGIIFNRKVETDENGQVICVSGNINYGSPYYELKGNQILAFNERLTKIIDFDDRLYVFKYLIFII
ncbi:MAG: hypothetical protein H6622_16965 [Halobacteriovoraceae bacterium]|nr:hypothetical protein [Halobacteriovoraceae bacterium]